METTNRYDSLIQYYGELHNVDFDLLKSQIKAESNFEPFVQSTAGACGLAQFMEETFCEWFKILYKFEINSMSWFLYASNPEVSICLQAAYMSFLLIRYGGNVSHALAAYNWGMGHVDKIHERADFENLLPDETREYVERILS